MELLAFVSFVKIVSTSVYFCLYASVGVCVCHQEFFLYKCVRACVCVCVCGWGGGWVGVSVIPT